MAYLSGEVLVNRAQELAELAHEGQMYGSEPYIRHVLHVTRIVQGWGYGPEVQATTLLHDTLEDTWLTAAILRAEEIPPSVIDGIEAMTYRPDEKVKLATTFAWCPTTDGRESKRRRQVSKAIQDPLALVGKCADSGANREVGRQGKNPIPRKTGETEDEYEIRRLERIALYGRTVLELTPLLPTPAAISQYIAFRSQQPGGVLIRV